MENLETNSASTQPQTQNAKETNNSGDPGPNSSGDPGPKNSGDPGPRKPGRPDRRVIEALKRLWNRIFN